MQQKYNYNLALILSIAMHLILLFAVIFVVKFPTHLPPVVKKGHDVNIVQAVAINQQQVENEVKKLKEQQEAKKQAEINFARKIQNQAKAAEHERKLQADKLATLRKQQQLLKKKQIEQKEVATKQLARIQAQKIKAQRELKQIQSENQKAIQAQKQAEAKIAEIKKQKAIAEKKREQDAKDLLTQQLKQEQKQLAEQKSQYINGVVDKYRALMVNQIESHWIIPPNINQKLKLTLQIQLNIKGDVENVSLQKSSGNSVLDRTAINAVYNASPLPVPKNPAVFAKFRQFSILMTPSSLINESGKP